MKNGKVSDMPPTETKEPKTKLQRAMEHKSKYEQFLGEAKQDELDAVAAAIKNLEELGFKYTLIPTEELEALKAPKPQIPAPRASKSAGATKSSAKAAPGPSANYDADKKCAVCGVVGHDGRAHRLKKEKFDEAQLKELGLMPPDGQLVHSPTV